MHNSTTYHLYTVLCVHHPSQVFINHHHHLSPLYPPPPHPCLPFSWNHHNIIHVHELFFLMFLIIDLTERKSLICCSTYWCIHWFIPICALTGNQTHSPGVYEWHAHQLSYTARAVSLSFFSFALFLLKASAPSPTLSPTPNSCQPSLYLWVCHYFAC